MFGPGTHLVLQQPDHWRMIEEVWFSEEDLYHPTDIDDPAYRTWHANYKPEAEAHDLLCDLLQDRITGVFRGRIPELGLKLSEHPSTRRLALAKLDHEECLPRLAEAVASRTTWVVIDLFT